MLNIRLEYTNVHIKYHRYGIYFAKKIDDLTSNPHNKVHLPTTTAIVIFIICIYFFVSFNNESLKIEKNI